MQDAVPHGGFYAIKVHHLIGSFSAVLEVREGICGGRLVNATCCVNLSLMVKVSVAFLCSYDSIYAWDVENTWLTSLICISDC